MEFVLDSSAIFSRHIPDSGYITPEVEMEIKDSSSAMDIMSHINSGRVSVRCASSQNIDKVAKVAKGTGDALSRTDITVIALALDIGATIVTDDYGILNVAKRMGISCTPAKTVGINELLTWGKKCTGCGRKYSSDHDGECEVCGSPLKRYARKRTKL